MQTFEHLKELDASTRVRGLNFVIRQIYYTKTPLSFQNISSCPLVSTNINFLSLENVQISLDAQSKEIKPKEAKNI